MLLILVSQVYAAAIKPVEISPSYPAPNEELTCTINGQGPGQFHFRWTINDVNVHEEITADFSNTLNENIEVQDRVNCIAGRFINGITQLIGADTVTVGEFECNDGLDNDGDGTIDFGEDEDCEGRFDFSELNLRDTILPFCNNGHPNNLFCLGLGQNDLTTLCNNFPDADACQYLDPFFISTCEESPASDFCEGHRDVANFCLNQLEGGEDLSRTCQYFLSFTQECILGANRACWDLTDEDIALVCGLDDQHDFCADVPLYTDICQEGKDHNQEGIDPSMSANCGCLNENACRGIDDFGNCDRNLVQSCEDGYTCKEVNGIEGCYEDDVAEIPLGEVGDSCAQFNCKPGLVCDDDICKLKQDRDNQEEEEIIYVDCFDGETRLIPCNSGVYEQTCEDDTWQGECPREIVVQEEPRRPQQNSRADTTTNSQLDNANVQEAEYSGKSNTKYWLIPVVVILLGVIGLGVYSYFKDKTSTKKKKRKL